MSLELYIEFSAYSAVLKDYIDEFFDIDTLVYFSRVVCQAKKQGLRPSKL
jgi:hypothetical protein